MKSTQLDFFKNLYPDGNWRDIQPLKNNEIGYAITNPSFD